MATPSLFGISSLVARALPGLFSGQPVSPYAPDAAETARLARYTANWSHYTGEKLDALKLEDGTQPTTVNFLRRNIDKINYFAFGLGYSANHPRLNDHLSLARQCWGPLRLTKLATMAQFGSVTGDAFIVVSPDGPTNEVCVAVVPSAYCRPYHGGMDGNQLLRLTMTVPYTAENGETQYTLFDITPEQVTTGTLDANYRPIDPVTVQPNPLKEVYAVHIANLPQGNSIYGADDIKDVAALNTAYTERLADIGNIVNYHAAPVTCIFGAKATNLVRGADKVWGNLPINARVETLKSEGNLDAANAHLATVKQGLHELTGVPEIAQGSAQAISNTSGVALHTMYLPLIERASTKQTLYGPKIMEVDRLALKWCFLLNKRKLIDPDTGAAKQLEVLSEDQWRDLHDNTELTFPSPLPKDELIQVQVQTTRVQAGLQSRRGALIALGVKNVDVVLREIEDDEAKAAKRAMEQAQFTTGLKQTPEKTGSTSGEPTIDTGKAGMESGASASQGTNTSDSSEPKGRPKTA